MGPMMNRLSCLAVKECFSAVVKVFVSPGMHDRNRVKNIPSFIAMDVNMNLDLDLDVDVGMNV